MSKQFVEVIVKYRRDGTQIPMTIFYGDHKYEIDKVTDIRQAPSLKAGGQGLRYTCSISGHSTYMWLEDDKWFVEGKDYSPSRH